MRRKGFQPPGDIDTIETRLHVGGENGVSENQIVANHGAHQLLLSSMHFGALVSRADAPKHVWAEAERQ
jgi:hypothetical protein